MENQLGQNNNTRSYPDRIADTVYLCAEWAPLWLTAIGVIGGAYWGINGAMEKGESLALGGLVGGLIFGIPSLMTGLCLEGLICEEDYDDD